MKLCKCLCLLYVDKYQQMHFRNVRALGELLLFLIRTGLISRKSKKYNIHHGFSSLLCTSCVIQ